MCEAYRKAESPEEAAMVLQRYALRFTISDATLDSLKLPRSTPKPKVEQTQVLQEHTPTQSTVDSETSDLLHKPEPTITMDQQHKPEEIGGNAQERSVSFSSSTPALNNSPDTTITHSQHTPPQSQEPSEPQTQHKESPTTNQQPLSKDTPPQAKEAPPQTAQTPPHSVEPVHTQPCTTAPSRPVPLLTAKPYCQPRNTHSGHKSVKVRA